MRIILLFILVSILCAQNSKEGVVRVFNKDSTWPIYVYKMEDGPNTCYIVMANSQTLSISCVKR